jgi:hypothetical protein
LRSAFEAGGEVFEGGGFGIGSARTPLATATGLGEATGFKGGLACGEETGRARRFGLLKGGSERPRWARMSKGRGGTGSRNRKCSGQPTSLMDRRPYCREKRGALFRWQLNARSTIDQVCRDFHHSGDESEERTCRDRKREETETSAELLHDAIISDRRGLSTVSEIALASTQDESEQCWRAKVERR